MSACPPQNFRRCATFDGCFAGFIGSVGVVRRNANTVGEPLAPYAGAAAFLLRAAVRSLGRAFIVKEPIEDQANRHL
ncbi:MAG: hypothetical protein PCALPYG88_0826 [uncultured Paraburkholderia sp.]|jgi:hypothetical protein|nr:hypothetical protein BZM26_31435 [Paraburkholderia strydomiana]CAH2894211.1 MAG: hypothetical protein PCALPYG08_0825 [uncultured Paraburkholderia sp.]CAH2911579.1 MAG: hypothetical protein PCALPYG88_0826 [uncultured Paraburkholderia sp.]